MNTRLPRLVLAALLLVGSAAAALADPPGQVGRLSDVEGSVSLHQPDQSDWSAAGPNYPVIAGDALWTAAGSRAEMQMGPAEIRLDEQTEIDVLRLDDGGGVQIRLDQGVLNLHLMAEPPGGLHVMTEAGRLDLARPGSYHVDAGHPASAGAPPVPVQFSVLDGEAKLVTARSSTAIASGQGAVVPVDQSSISFVTAAMTPFDEWAVDRERQEEARQAAQYVSPEMTGYQDLDRYGQWSTQPDYGPVWIPTAVGPDWAPYRFGHWAYVAPWGWTWVDDAPWGFAPFHYGRWFEWHGRWAWTPGRAVERPVYAPALVAFIGGAGRDIGAGPAVGWVPLAPHEAFHPYYPASAAYVRNVNVSHVTNFTTIGTVTVNNYANRQAMTAVPNAAFTGAAPVHRAALPMDPDRFAHLPVTTSLGHLQPSPAAVHQAPPPAHGGPAGGAPAAPQAHPWTAAPPPHEAPLPSHPAPQAAPAAMPQAPRPQPQAAPAVPPQAVRPQPHMAPHPQPAPAQSPPPQPHPQPVQPAQHAPAQQAPAHPPAPHETPHANPQHGGHDEHHQEDERH